MQEAVPVSFFYFTLSFYNNNISPIYDCDLERNENHFCNGRIYQLIKIKLCVSLVAFIHIIKRKLHGCKILFLPLENKIHMLPRRVIFSIYLVASVVLGIIAKLAVF